MKSHKETTQTKNNKNNRKKFQPVGVTLVKKIHIFDKQAEERDRKFKLKGK